MMSRDKPQVQTLHKHPKPYQHDLNPDAMAGQNIGLGEMHAGPNNWIVAKKEVPYELWNRLREEERS
jgi:hypothetical protein